MYLGKDAHVSKLVFFKPGFEVCSWKSRKISLEIYWLEVHTAECTLPSDFVGFQCACVALIKSTLFLSLTGLGAIIAEERNYMESYTFFKVRNVVASKGNTSSGHFTTPHASYFTENINKK